MTKIFLTSDTHFYHKNIIKYCNRPFTGVEDMNEKLIQNWNSVVRSGDTVYHLGDFGLGNKSRLADIRSQLNGKIFLILGNHDQHISKPQWIECVGMDGVYDSFDLDEFHLNHYPRLPEPYEFDLYDHLRPQVTDRWILCGHIHEKWGMYRMQYNMGVDVHGFKPIILQQVRKDIKETESK